MSSRVVFPIAFRMPGPKGPIRFVPPKPLGHRKAPLVGESGQDLLTVTRFSLRVERYRAFNPFLSGDGLPPRFAPSVSL
jgi:hypothetical protein